MAGDAVVVDAEETVHAEQMFRVAVLNGKQGCALALQRGRGGSAMFLACTKYLFCYYISFDVLETIPCVR